MTERERFEKWKLKHSANPRVVVRDVNGDYQYLDTRGDWYVWQAALSTRKPYGFGIVDKYGRSNGLVFIHKRTADDLVEAWNIDSRENGLKPHTVIELFYEDQP